MGKAVDSLRILTTGNDPNKVALVGIPSSLASLVRLMAPDKPNVRAWEVTTALLQTCEVLSRQPATELVERANLPGETLWPCWYKRDDAYPAMGLHLSTEACSGTHHLLLTWEA